MKRQITDPEEIAFVEQYKKDVQSGKYPVQCITVDICIFWRGKVLMVKRGNWPQKGFWALPGGFVNETERLEEAAYRECKEETGITLGPDWLFKTKYFDEPERAPGVRILTHAFGFEIPKNIYTYSKPEAGDDAAEVAWMNVLDVLDTEPEEWFEDHWWIIHQMWNRTNK